MTPRDALRLGRVSNLPTVWTNVLAGVTLSGVEAGGAVVGLLVASLSLFYVAGMYLNDAFDRAIDARERPERPIPSGRVRAGTVFAWGFGMMACGLGLLFLAGTSAGTGLRPVAAGAGLAAAILVYDTHHKGNPWSPVVMGACRALVYVTAAVAVAGTVSPAVAVGAVALLAWIAGLSYAARHETRHHIARHWPLAVLAVPFGLLAWALPWTPLAATSFAALLVWAIYALGHLLRRRPDVPGGVVRLIAGVSLLDAAFIATRADWPLVVAAAAGCASTRLLQRFVPGT